MAKPTLWFPYGLYLQTFKPQKNYQRKRDELKKARQKGGDRRRIDQLLRHLRDEEGEADNRMRHAPFSSWLREFESCQVYVTARQALAHPGGFIVNKVVDSAAPNCIPVTHDAKSSPGVLHCATFEAVPLSLFENIDLLAYCDQVFAACRRAFGIRPATGDPDNLRPVDELLAVWSGAAPCATAWPDAAVLAAQGCPPWLASSITGHPRAADPTSRLRHNVPGYEELFLELLYDADATRVIENLVGHSPAGGRADVTEIVHAVISDLTRSVFANAGRWRGAAAEVPPSSEDRIITPATPNWRGYVIRQIAGKWDRELATLLGLPQHDAKGDVPWAKGKELHDALRGALGPGGLPS